MGCLCQIKGEIAAKKIRSLTNQSVDVVTLDLADFSSVRQFVKSASLLTTKVHILVNNAGSKSFGPIPVFNYGTIY